MFTGCGTALVTPFRSDFSLDEAAMRALVKRQIEAGIDFLCPCGTTGESPTLTRDEHLRVVEITVEAAQAATPRHQTIGGISADLGAERVSVVRQNSSEESRTRVPVLAGAGGYNTREVIELIAELRKLRVDGILSVTPYYNKPTQEGLYQHYRAIAESTDLPIIVYSVQPRTAVNIEPATLLRLTEIPNIIGVKEASGSISQMGSILARIVEPFIVLSGDDAVTIPLAALGGHGVISVVSNEIPAEFKELSQAAIEGNFARARTLQRKYQELMEINFIETSPGPVKFAMARMGLLEPVWRLPLVAPQKSSQQRIEAVLQSLDLLTAEREWLRVGGRA